MYRHVPIFFLKYFYQLKPQGRMGYARQNVRVHPVRRKDNAYFNIIQTLHCIITLLSIQNNAYIAPEVAL